MATLKSIQIFLLLILNLSLAAQNFFKLEGTLLDSHTGTSLAGAHVIMKSYGNNIVGTALVIEKGYFRID